MRFFSQIPNTPSFLILEYDYELRATILFPARTLSNVPAEQKRNKRWFLPNSRETRMRQQIDSFGRRKRQGYWTPLKDTYLMQNHLFIFQISKASFRSYIRDFFWRWKECAGSGSEGMRGKFDLHTISKRKSTLASENGLLKWFNLRHEPEVQCCPLVSLSKDEIWQKLAKKNHEKDNAFAEESFEAFFWLHL